MTADEGGGLTAVPAAEWLILMHDCEVDEHDYRTIGPFDTYDEAQEFLVRHELMVPCDGGYAFAVTLGPHSGLTAEEDPHGEMWEDDEKDDTPQEC